MTIAEPLHRVVDAGNGLVKYVHPELGPQHFQAWVAVPTREGDELPGSRRTGPTLLQYVDGPAADVIARVGSRGFLIGDDAQRSGHGNLNAIGETSQRVYTAAYALLTLAGLLASLPKDMTTAHVYLIIGVPVESSHEKDTEAALQQRFCGRHLLQWGAVSYDIVIEKLLIIPQPLGAIATLRFDRQGNPRYDQPRQILLADIGTGTTDTTGRGGANGLEELPGTQHGLPLGVKTISGYLREPLAERLQVPLAKVTQDKVLSMVQCGVAQFDSLRTEIAAWLALDPRTMTVDQALFALYTRASLIDRVLRCATMSSAFAALRAPLADIGIASDTLPDALQALAQRGWIVGRDDHDPMHPGVDVGHRDYLRARPPYDWFALPGYGGTTVEVSDLLAPAIAITAEQLWKDLLAVWEMYIAESQIVISAGGAVLLGDAVRRVALGNSGKRLQATAITVVHDRDDVIYGALPPVYRNLVGFGVLGQLMAPAAQRAAKVPARAGR